MQEATLTEMKIKLPRDIAETTSSKEIVEMLLDKALSKAEYYLSRCNEYKARYGGDFASFKKKAEKAKKEVFADWDDLIVWEGYELGYKEWNKKYEELKSCMA